jgi:hypothetical protein
MLAVRLSSPLALELSRCLLLQNKLGIDNRRNRRRSLTRRWRKQQIAGNQLVAKFIGFAKGIYAPTLFFCTLAQNSLDNLGLHANAKQIHPLVRSSQNPRIVPRQLLQVLTVDTQFASGLGEVTKMPCKRERGVRAAEMSECGWTLRHERQISASV